MVDKVEEIIPKPKWFIIEDTTGKSCLIKGDAQEKVISRLNKNKLYKFDITKMKEISIIEAMQTIRQLMKETKKGLRTIHRLSLDFYAW